MSSDIESGFQPSDQDLPGAAHPAGRGGGRHEQRLLEYLDGGTAPAERRQMLEHIRDCAQCSAMAREWGELDAQLAAHFKSVAMAPGFSAKVWRAIESLPTYALGAGASKGGLESDWPDAWARLRRRYLWTVVPMALDHVGYAFAIVLAVCLSARIMLHALNAWSLGLESGWLALLAYGLGLSAPIFLLGFLWAVKRPLARLLAFL